VNGPALRFLRPIAQGATGSVHLAELLEASHGFPVGAQVAVKRPLPGVPPSVIEWEANVLGEVWDAGLVTSLGLGQDVDGPYLITEWLGGDTLSDRLESDGPASAPELRALVRSMAGALATLHEQGWLHGDVAPDNVRTDADGHPRLLDLGLASAIGSGGRGRGTPAYLSPEELDGRPKDTAAEMFAMGLVLRTMATGAHPLAADVRAWVPAAMPRAESYERMQPAWVVEPNLPADIDDLLERLLHPDPDRRPSAAEVRDEWSGNLQTVRARNVRAVSRQDLPWAGRRDEVQRICDAWDRSRATSRPHVVWLSGPTGTGRGRFVREAVAVLRAGGTPPVHLVARCGGALESRPAQPVRALLRRWLNLPRHAAPGAREERLLRELVPPGTAEALLASLDPDVDLPLAAEPALLAEWWCALAARTPLVVLLSDLDRAGRGTLEVIGRVAVGLASTGALTVLDRSDPCEGEDPYERLAGRFDEVADSQVMTLAPLSPEETIDLAEALFWPENPVVRIGQALHERTDGRANLIATVLRAARTDHEVVGRSTLDAKLAERLTLTIEPERLPWPLSEAGELLGALDEADKLWLVRCAVAGKRLHPAFLERSWPTPEDAPNDGDTIASVLDRLESAGWLERRQGGLRFASPTLREAALREVDAPTRRELHMAAAHALDTADKNDTTTGRSFERAYHLHAAEAWDALLAVTMTLMERATLEGHPERAVSMASWGLEALDRGAHHPEPRLARFDLLTTAADAAGRAGNRAQESRALDRLVDLPLDPELEPARMGHVYLLHGHHAADTGRFGLARGMLRNSAIWLERGKDLEGASEARRRLAEVHIASGDLRGGAREARAARDLARSPATASFARVITAEVGLLEDRFEPALRQVERVLRRLRDENSTRLISEVRARASMIRSRILRQMGRFLRAHAAVEQAAREARISGERSLEAEAAARRGRLLVDLNRERDALRVLRDVLWTAREIQDARVEVLGELFLGTLLAEQNQAEGEQHLARAATLAASFGMQRVEGLSLSLLARVAWHDHDFELAMERSTKAMSKMELVGAELGDRIVIVATHALILESLGESASAARIDRKLREHVSKTRSRLRLGWLRQRHDLTIAPLIELARSPSGPIYPRSAE
tara:strand:+ start:2773 stop:6180 length:3408 start_codon:yes stop_codon:yes gene_type:complete